MKGAWIALSARYGTALLLVVLAAVGPFLLSQFNLLQLSALRPWAGDVGFGAGVGLCRHS